MTNFQILVNGKPQGTILCAPGQLPQIPGNLWGVIDRLPSTGPVMPMMDPLGFERLLTGLSGHPIVTPHGTVMVRRYK